MLTTPTTRRAGIILGNAKIAASRVMQLDGRDPHWNKVVVPVQERGPLYKISRRWNFQIGKQGLRHRKKAGRKEVPLNKAGEGEYRPFLRRGQTLQEEDPRKLVLGEGYNGCDLEG